MPVKSFNINLKNSEAKNGICEITFDLGLQPKQIVHGVSFLTEEKLVGSVTNENGLNSGNYKVTLDFTGLGNGPYVVQSVIYKQPGAEVIHAGVPFTVIATNIGDPKAAPEPIRFEVKSKQASLELNPIINYKLSALENIDLGSTKLDITTAIDGVNIGNILTKDGVISIKPETNLGEGLRYIDISINSLTRPDVNSKLKAGILIDRRAPIIEIEPVEEVTTNTLPEFHVKARDIGSGVDGNSIVVTLNGMPAQMLVTPIVEQEINTSAPPPVIKIDQIASAAVSTYIEIKKQLSLFQLSSSGRKILLSKFENVNEALVRGYPSVARKRMGNLIVSLVQMYHSFEDEKNTIPDSEVSTLLCSATNFLVSMPLGKTTYKIIGNEIKQKSISELKAFIKALKFDEAFLSKVSSKVDHAEEAVEAGHHLSGADQLAKVILFVINYSENLPVGISLNVQDLNKIVFEVMSALVTCSLTYKSDNDGLYSDIISLISNVNSSNATKKMLNDKIAEIEVAMDKGRVDEAYRNVGDLIVTIIRRSSYIVDKNPNEIQKNTANILLEKARTILDKITAALPHVCINQCSSMVATISELQIVLNMWTMKASVAEALQQSLLNAEKEMTSGDINRVRKPLGKFVHQLMRGLEGVTDANNIKFTIDQTNSLVYGVVNIITGNIPWKKFKISPPFKLCDGNYNYGFSISDIAGNRCTEVKKTILIDTSVPRVISVLPGAEEIVAGRNFKLEILTSDSTLPLFLSRPAASLSEGNELFAEILTSNGLATIADILLLNNSPGVLKDSLMQPILRAQTFEKIAIETEKYSNVLYWKCAAILESPVAELQKLVNVPVIEIEQLQTTLSDCKALGLPLFNDLFLYEFAHGKPSEVAQFTLLLDGKDITNKSSRENNYIRYASSAELPEGDHQFDLKLIDRAGNTSAFHSAFYVDTTAPAITQVKPANGLRTNQKDILIAAKFSDEKAGVDPKNIFLEVDGKDVTGQVTVGNNQISFMLYEPAEGLHTFKIKCADMVGNVAILDSQSFFIDRTKPTVIIDPLLDESATVNSKMLITGTLSEKASVKVNGKAATVNTDLTFSVAVDLQPGHNRFIATAIDLAGNESASNASDIYLISKNECAVTGIIRNENDVPVYGVVITSSQGRASAVTNESGRFSITGLPAGNLVLNINPVPLEADGYKPFIIEKMVSYGSVTELQSIVYLLKTRIGEGTDIARDNQVTEIVSLNDNSVSLSIKNDLIEFPEENTRRIVAYTVDSNKLPVDVPEFFPQSPVVVLEPAGLTVKSGDGIHISFPNTFSLEKGTIVPLISYDSKNAKWGIGGMGKVSEDEQTVSSMPGLGLRHFSYVAPCPPGPQIEPLREDIHIPGADALKGGLETSIELPSFRSLGQEIKPELIYSSLTAAPTVQVTGVFKGMKEISEVTTEVLKPLDEALTGQRMEATDEYSQWISGGTSGKMVGHSVMHQPVMYIPAGEASPFSPLPAPYWDGQGKVLTVATRNMVTTDLTFYKLKIRTDIKKESHVWPESITSRYFFSYQDTGEFTLVGALQKKGPAPLLGEVDDRPEYPTLPENMAITYHLEPIFSDGSFYPTGLYSYLARYHVKGRGYQSVQYSRVADFVFVDEGFLNYLKEMRQTEAYNGLVSARELYRSGPEVRTQSNYSDPLDYLFHNDAGALIIHNLTHSSFGKGWRLKEVHELHPVGQSQVLVVSPEGKHIFTVTDTVQTIAKGIFGVISFSPVSAKLCGAGPGGTDKVKRDALFSIGASNEKLAQLSPVIRKDIFTDFESHLYEKLDHYETWSNCVGTYHPSGIPWIDGYWTTECSGGSNPVYTWAWSDEKQVDQRTKETIVIPEIAGIAFSENGRIYFSDKATHRIFQLDPNGQPVLIAGKLAARNGTFRIDTVQTNQQHNWTKHEWSGEEIAPGFSPDGTLLSNSNLNTPGGIVVDTEGNLLVAEKGANKIRRLNFQTGVIETVLGTGSTQYDPTTKVAGEVNLPSPMDIALSPSGDLFILFQLGGQFQGIGCLDAAGNYKHVAGNVDGTIDVGVDARVYKLIDARRIAIDNKGKLFVSFGEQNRVMVILQNGFIEPVAGNGEMTNEFPDGVSALQSSVIHPDGLAISPEGNLIFVDSGHEAVRLVTYAQNNLGFTLYKGPLGYYDSKLQRESDGTWLRKYKNGNTVTFDASGRHVQTKDKNGNETRYQYDSNHRLANIIYPGNSSLQFRYDSSGIIQEIEDHAGRINRFTVVNGNIVKANMVDYINTEFNYDVKDRIVSRKEANGLVTEYTYNDYGRVVQKTSNGGLVSIDRPDDRYAGNEAATNTQVTADSSLTNVATSDGQNVAYQADTSSSTIVKNNRSFDSFSNSQMLLGRSQRPNGTTIDFSYDDNGNLLQLEDSATDGVERSEYNEKDQMTLHVNASGRISRWRYDEAGNVIEKRVGNNSLVSSWQYNANGLVLQQSENGVTTLFEYDEHGNVSKVQQGDLITQYQHDLSGNVTKKTEANLRNAQYEYNLLNWLVKVISPAGKATLYEYNLLGNLTSVMDSLGNKTLFEYDLQKNRTAKTDSSGSTYWWRYDENGQLIWESGQNGTPIIYEYKNNGSTVVQTAGDDVITVDKWEDGSLHRARRGTMRIERAYDNGARCKGDEITLPGMQPKRVIHENDISGKLIGILSPNDSSQKVSYEYDDTDHLNSLTFGTHYIRFNYDEGGRVTGIQRSNGSHCSISYNSAGRHAEIVEKYGDKNLWQSKNTYNEFGECSRIEYIDAVANFTYDKNGWLISGEYKNNLVAYEYDEIGNRLKGPGGTFICNPTSSRLLEDDTWFYIYDEQGNLVEKQDKNKPPHKQKFSYSSFGELTAFRELDGQEIPLIDATYSFDPLHRRVGKRVVYRDNPEKNITRWWLHDGPNIYLEYDENFQSVRQYFGTGEVDGILGFTEGDEVYFFIKDSIGSVRQIVDNNGTTVASYEYGAFGEIISENASIECDIRYTGRLWDAESKTYQYRTRQYDPYTGRFLQPDPAKGKQDMPITIINRYIYAGNNPIRYIDPMGENFGDGFWDGVGVVLGVVAAIITAPFWVPCLVAGLFAAYVGAFLGGVILGIGYVLFYGEGSSNIGDLFLEGFYTGWDWGGMRGAHLMGLGLGIAVGSFYFGRAVPTGKNVFDAFAQGFEIGWRTGTGLFAQQKWTFQKDGQMLKGEMTFVYLNDGAMSDGDVCAFIKPDPEYNYLLKNRNGRVNLPVYVGSVYGGPMELEIEVQNKHAQNFTMAAFALIKQKVTAYGVFINDDGHDGKTELHPLDCLYGEIPESDWSPWATIKRNNVPHDGFKVIRFLSAGDDSWVLHPPGSLKDRIIDVQIRIEIPPRFGLPMPQIDWGWARLHNATDSEDPSIFRIVKNPKDNLCFQIEVTPYHVSSGPHTIMVDLAYWWKEVDNSFNQTTH